MTDRSLKSQLELAFCMKMAAWFAANNVQFTWQQDVNTGHTDFVLPKTKTIIEVKISGELHTLMQAMGQLLFYKHTLKDYHITIGLPAGTVPDEAATPVLTKYLVKFFDTNPIGGL
jgi:hypothetical protein